MSLVQNMVSKMTIARDLSPLDRDIQYKGRIKQAFSTFTGNFSRLVLVNLITLIFALPLLGVFFVWLKIDTDKLIDTFTLVNGLGIGYGAVDQTIEGIVAIYDLRQSFVLYYLTLGIMIFSIGMAGCYNVCRNFLWGVNNSNTKVKELFGQFFKGIKRHWYKFLVSYTFLGLVATNFIYALLETIKQVKAYGSASAGVWCWVVFGGLFALLTVMYLINQLPMFVCYKFSKKPAENYKAMITNTIVETLLSLVGALIIVILFAVPCLFIFVNIINYVLYVCILGFGFAFYALMNLAYGQNVSDMYLGYLYNEQQKKAKKESNKEKKTAQKQNKNRKR